MANAKVVIGSFLVKQEDEQWERIEPEMTTTQAPNHIVPDREGQSKMTETEFKLDKASGTDQAPDKVSTTAVDPVLSGNDPINLKVLQIVCMSAKWTNNCDTCSSN